MAPDAPEPLGRAAPRQRLKFSMSNQTSLSVPTEIMTPGQTSDALRVKLKQAGSRITDAQIETAWNAAEKDRVSFSCSATAVGVMLFAKKEFLGHGKWIPWCEKFGGKLAASVSGKLAAPLPIRKEVTPRSLRVYTQLGEHFLSSLEQGEFAGEVQDHKPKLEGVTPDQVLALDHLPAKSRKQVFGKIEQFVAGRSLRTMLLDLRRAENAADDELAAHERAQAGKTRGTKGGTGSSPGQLDFWNPVKKQIDQLDTLMQEPSTVKHAPKSFWDQLATALEEQAKVARQRAKEMQS